MIANQQALATKSGPAYNLWVKRQTEAYAAHVRKQEALAEQRWRQLG